jgi:hypothetical protein
MEVMRIKKLKLIEQVEHWCKLIADHEDVRRKATVQLEDHVFYLLADRRSVYSFKRLDSLDEPPARQAESLKHRLCLTPVHNIGRHGDRAPLGNVRPFSDESSEKKKKKC